MAAIKSIIDINKDLIVPAMIGVGMIAIFLVVSKVLSVVLVFIPAVILTYLLYVSTVYREVPPPAAILPIYSFALGVQFIHFAEEFVMGFNTEMPKLLGEPAYSINYWVVFNMVAYFLFILGVIILFKQIKRFMIVPLFFIVAGVILNAVGHLLLAIYTGGYFPGLYTALIYLALGPILLRRITITPKVETTNLNNP